MGRQGEASREEQPYYNVDVAIGQLRLWDHHWLLRLQAHVDEETWYRFVERPELISLHERRGTRTYVHAKPYILEPQIDLTILLGSGPDSRRAIGTVVGSEWTGMRRQIMGNAQAWYYPTEQTIILWECFLYRHAAQHTMTRGGETHDVGDPNLRVPWQGFERFLISRFSDAEQIVTTHTDPLYDTTTYQRFLDELGYRRIRSATLGKEVIR